MEKIFMNKGNSKTNEPHKTCALPNLSIYYKWKNTRQQYKNNKLKIIAPT